MIMLLIVLVLLAISAFVSASEVAFFSLTPNQKEELDESDTLTDHQIKELLKDPQYLLATILITNNFVNVGIIVLSSLLLSLYCDFGDNAVLQFIVETVIITFVILLLGEIMPKIFSRQHALKMCRASASAIAVLKKVLRPFNVILVNSTSFINKQLEHHSHNNPLSMDELSHALELTEGTIEEDKDILQGIVKFGNLTAASVMTPRMDMITIPFNATFDNVISCINEHEYSRIPVLQGSYDNIRGILYAKDLIPHIGKGANFKWQTLLRQPFFVPETKKIDDLLEEFQKNRIHIAIVVDEFGGTSGLVTLEDVLEEVVGDISDEYDEEDKMYVKHSDTSFTFEAKIPLSDFIRAIDPDNNMNQDEMFEDYIEDVDTLAGLILEIKGEFPKQNEHIEFHNLDFEIVSMDARRITKVKVTIK